MIKIEKAETYGWEAAIRGMRNPMNSWDKIDSKWDGFGEADGFSIGNNDIALMKKLCKAGTDHRKFMRMIAVYVDVTAPLYWWKEYDTYKVGTVVNSCSTMHKIHEKEFTFEDFSYDKLYSDYDAEDLGSIELLNLIITALNRYRERYLQTKDKDDWYQIIQLLPSSYNQKRTLMLNYEVLANIYKSRKNHKLDEWRTFCEWIETLPYSEIITGGEPNDNP